VLESRASDDSVPRECWTLERRDGVWSASVERFDRAAAVAGRDPWVEFDSDATIDFRDPFVAASQPRRATVAESCRPCHGEAGPLLSHRAEFVVVESSR